LPSEATGFGDSKIKAPQTNSNLKLIFVNFFDNVSFIQVIPILFNTRIHITNFHLKKNQLGAQFIFNILRHTSLHVSHVSTAHHQEVHRSDTKIGTYCSY